MTNGKIGTGFIGTPAILPALVKIGAVDLAEKLFLQPDVPGWLYQVEQGATTIWERWDAIRADGTIYDPDMNSYNHYAYGAVCQWLLEGVAGFRPDPEQPGLPSASSSSRRSCPRSASCGRATTRRPGASRPAGRVDGRRGRLHGPGARGRRGAAGSRPGHAEPTVDGAALTATPTERPHDARAGRTPHRLPARVPRTRTQRINLTVPIE